MLDAPLPSESAAVLLAPRAAFAVNNLLDAVEFTPLPSGKPIPKLSTPP